MADPSAVSCAKLVDQVCVTDEFSDKSMTTRYRYHDGVWDGVEREFRGFAQVDQYDTAGGYVAGHSDPVLTRMWFHVGVAGQADASAEPDLHGKLNRRPATDRPLSGERVADRPDRPETPPGAASTGRQAPPQRAIQGGHRNGLATRRLPTAVHNHRVRLRSPPRRRRPRRHADRRRFAPRGTDHAMGARSRADDPGSL